VGEVASIPNGAPRSTSALSSLGREECQTYPKRADNNLGLLRKSLASFGPPSAAIIRELPASLG